MFPRSYLFVPACRPERFGKAASSGAQQIIIDLEDAVGPEDKEAARRNALDWFSQGGMGALRINGADSPWFDADLTAVSGLTDITVMVPKASAQTLGYVSRRLPNRKLLALVESVDALVHIHDLASTPGVARLAFGNLDFSLDARMPCAGPALDPARFAIAMASRQAGLPPPIDGVTIELEDEATLASDIERARALGFTAKLCIHPRQVGQVNEGFAPSVAEAAWARRILDATEKGGGGAVRVDGRMVDRPVLERARAIMAALN